MLKLVIALVLATAVIFAAQAQQPGQNWAVLVAGSNGYYNYRHQSDVCHAFQILKKNGIPASNIIVMMYDDIANNSQNPKKGTIINCPGCPNVYTPDVPKDYTKELVTPQNFIKILKGEDMTGIGSGKTLKTGPNDKVFVYWTDHGGPGIIAFPTAMLHAADLIATLKYMYENKKYKELVFYLEACESGSMFHKLIPTNWNIYVTTASNPFESSYACNYDSTYRAYLNDCYSINWMNHTEYSNVWSTSLQTQYEVVKKVTTQSHVCQYGDVSIANEMLGEFQAHKNGALYGLPHRAPLKNGDFVSSRDVKGTTLRRILSEENLSPLERNKYKRYLAEHEALTIRGDVVWGAFAHKLNLKPIAEAFATADDRCHTTMALDLQCVKGGIEAAVRQCGMFTEETFKHTSKVRDACDSGYSVAQIEKELANICSVVAH